MTLARPPGTEAATVLWAAATHVPNYATTASGRPVTCNWFTRRGRRVIKGGKPKRSEMPGLPRMVASTDVWGAQWGPSRSAVDRDHRPRLSPIQVSDPIERNAKADLIRNQISRRWPVAVILAPRVVFLVIAGPRSLASWEARADLFFLLFVFVFGVALRIRGQL